LSFFLSLQFEEERENISIFSQFCFVLSLTFDSDIVFLSFFFTLYLWRIFPLMTGATCVISRSLNPCCLHPPKPLAFFISESPLLHWPSSSGDLKNGRIPGGLLPSSATPP